MNSKATRLLKAVSMLRKFEIIEADSAVYVTGSRFAASRGALSESVKGVTDNAKYLLHSRAWEQEAYTVMRGMTEEEEV